MSSDFKRLMASRFLYTLAVQMQAVVLGWRIYELLRDPLSLGMIGLAEAIPALGLALYAGYLVDRSRPLRVYRGVVFTSLISGALVLGEHLFSHSMNVMSQAGLLYSAAFLTGLARSFSQPSLYATVPHLLPRRELLQGTTKMSTAIQIARILGPALGGIVYGWAGAIVCSSAVCVLLVLAQINLWFIQKKIPAPEAQKNGGSKLEELFSGVKFVFSHPILLPALSLDMISVLFSGVTALLPIFAEEILLAGPKGLGALRAAPAIGAALMSLSLTRWPIRKNSGTWLLYSIAGFGVCILLFGWSRNLAFSVGVLALSGALDSVSMYVRTVSVQLSSPESMRGRIAAVNSIFIGSSNELGEVESGIAAKLMGTVPAVYFGGLMCLLTVAATAYLSPALRKLDLSKLEHAKPS